MPGPKTKGQGPGDCTLGRRLESRPPGLPWPSHIRSPETRLAAITAASSLGVYRLRSVVDLDLRQFSNALELIDLPIHEFLKFGG